MRSGPHIPAYPPLEQGSRTMKPKFLFVACLALASCFAHTQTGQYVTIGDPAPALKPAKWLKGAPISSFAKGKLYVVEFWATWCNPCKENIPHLTELAKKYKGQVSIIGVSIWESLKEGEGDPMKKVSDFVKDQGPKMDYFVAADGPKNVIADAWMKAASEGGIPCSFIINGEGKVAWIGHPAKMEDVLKKVIDGTYDVASAREKREIELNVTRPIDEAIGAKDYKKAVKAIDSALVKRPQLEYNLTYPRLVALYHADLEQGKTLSAKILKDSNQAIGAYQMMSSIFATQTDLSKPAYEFGRGIIDEAIKFDQGVFMFMAMKAATYFNMGDKAQAIKFGEESVALADKEPNASPQIKTMLKKNLEKYREGK
jgi:thiol-disulfide isomerase/thioredoxin